MKETIILEYDAGQGHCVLTNKDGHTFEFNPNTRNGEELFDFLSGAKVLNPDVLKDEITMILHSNAGINELDETEGIQLSECYFEDVIAGILNLSTTW